MNKPWTKTYGPGVPHEIDADAYPSVVALFDEGGRRLRRPAGLRVLRQDHDLRARSTPPRRRSPPGCRRKLGVKRGDRIALMCPNVFAFPIAMLGIVRAGAAQVNVNPLYTPRELAHQLNDAGAETIVIFGGSTPTLAEIIDQTPVRTVITVDLGDGIGLPIPSPAVDPRLAGAVRFADVLARGRGPRLRAGGARAATTSCSSSTPAAPPASRRARCCTHRNLVANAEQFKAFLPEAGEPGQRGRRRWRCRSTTSSG